MTAARFLARKSSCCNLRNQSIRGEDRRSKIASSAPRMAPKRKLIDQQQHPIGVGDRYTCIHRWCGYIMVVLPSAWSGLHPMPTSVLIGPTISERWQTMSGQSWPELRNLCNFRAPIVQIMASLRCNYKCQCIASCQLAMRNWIACQWSLIVDRWHADLLSEDQAHIHIRSIHLSYLPNISNINHPIFPTQKKKKTRNPAEICTLWSFVFPGGLHLLQCPLIPA